MEAFELKAKNDLQQILTLCNDMAKAKLDKNNIFNDTRTRQELLLFIQEMEAQLEAQLQFKHQWKTRAIGHQL